MSSQKPIKVIQLYFAACFFVDSFQFFGDLSDYYQAKQLQFYTNKQLAEAAGIILGCHLVVVKGSHSVNLYRHVLRNIFLVLSKSQLIFSCFG